MPTAETSLTMVRTIYASTLDLFAAWTNPKLMGRWLGSTDWPMTDAQVDPRVGGRNRFSVSSPEGEIHTTSGVYREFEPNRKLVMTWIYEGPHPGADRGESLLTVTFKEMGQDQTELTLLHEQIGTAEGVETLRSGWTACLDQLTLLFPRPQS
jgi:uncharacterized protein YndB with AHSA1/START domain